MSVFQFKEFQIIQKKNPLKVGTDSMLLGSFISAPYAKNALDIGSGTGVLCLMALQRNPQLMIDALEINEFAAEECALNIRNSPWKKSVKVHCLDFFNYQSEMVYDLIFSNPPFHVNGLKSGHFEKDQAKHFTIIQWRHFFLKCSQLLSQTGELMLIVPYDLIAPLTEIAGGLNLHLIKQIEIHGTPTKRFTRCILVFSHLAKKQTVASLIVRDGNGQYTKDYISLTKDFHAVDLSQKT